MTIDKALFRTLIHEGQEWVRDIELYERPFDWEDEGRYVLVGIRQAGKSYLLMRRARQLLASGLKLSQVVYINFDDERLLGMTADQLDLILQAYHVMSDDKPLLLFDEIQNIQGWEHFARRLANQRYRVLITGSNARMLSRDIVTTLGGRYQEALVLPYSFREYLEAQDIALTPEWELDSQRYLVQQQFNQYLQWGGFPELLLFRNKRKWLNDLYEKILLGDVVSRNHIRNDLALRLLIKRLAESVMQPTSYNRLAHLVKSVGVNITVSGVIDYLSHVQDAYLMFELENYASRFVERQTVKKRYFIDNGLLSIFLTDNVAPLLENLCALHLYRQHGHEVYFYHNSIEVDFYLPATQCAIQVACTLADHETLRRETSALIKLSSHIPITRMLIVTLDEERRISTSTGTDIEVLPVWKWLLQS